MVYGTLGLASGELHFWTDNAVITPGQTRSVGGYVVGIGVEHALSDSLSLRGAIMHYDFNEADYQTDVLYSGVSGDFTQIELGLMLRF